MVTGRLTSNQLTEEQIEVLRARFPYQMSAEWVGKIAAREGWREANTAYLAAERKRAAAAMQRLMGELGVDHARSREQALDLIEIAFEVFACREDFDGTITRDGDRLRIEVRRCPVFEAMEASSWHGVTACPSAHRRRGWFDALGVTGSDTLLQEQKWGDPSCSAELEIQKVA